MQQTPNYKLNLLEVSDTFSPAPLNENMEKLETAIAAEAAQRQTETAALDQRLKSFELHRFVYGTYQGNGQPWQTIQLDFTPVYLYLRRLPEQNSPNFLVAPGVINSDYARIVENGFQVAYFSNFITFNDKTHSYQYFAFA